MTRHTVITIELEEGERETRVRALVNDNEVRTTRVPKMGSLRLELVPLFKALVEGRAKYSAEAGAPDVHRRAGGYDPRNPRAYRCGGSKLFPEGAAPFGPIPKGAREPCIGCPDCDPEATTATSPKKSKKEAASTSTATAAATPPTAVAEASWAAIEAAWKAGEALRAMRLLFDSQTHAWRLEVAKPAPSPSPGARARRLLDEASNPKRKAGKARRTKKELRTDPDHRSDHGRELDAELRRMEAAGYFASPVGSIELFNEMLLRCPDLTGESSISRVAFRNRVKRALARVFGERLKREGWARGATYQIRKGK